MNSRCIYFVEGPCEDKLISAIKLNPSIIFQGGFLQTQRSGVPQYAGTASF